MFKSRGRHTDTQTIRQYVLKGRELANHNFLCKNLKTIQK